MSTLFMDLTPEEEEEFRQWARDNYKPYDPIKGIWHPVVQEECVRINKETELFVAYNYDEDEFER